MSDNVVLHEAVSTCKTELVEIVLQARDFHQSRQSAATIPRLLEIVQSVMSLVDVN